MPFWDPFVRKEPPRCPGDRNVTTYGGEIGSRSAVPVAEKTNSRARTAVADTKPATPSALAQSIPLPPPRPGNIARTRAPTAAPPEPARKAHTTRDARLAARQSRPTYRSLPAWADEIRRNFVVRTPPE